MTDVTDNFNRAGPALGANWTNVKNSIVITGSTRVIGGTASDDNISKWAPDTFTTDHYAEVTLAAGIGGQDGGPTVCNQSGSNSFYLMDLSFGGAAVQIYICSSGTFTPIGAGVAQTFAAGDVFRLTITGTTLTGQKNGAAAFITRTDSTLNGGVPGMHIFSNDTTTSWDAWLGGPLAATGGGSGGGGASRKTRTSGLLVDVIQLGGRGDVPWPSIRRRPTTLIRPPPRSFWMPSSDAECVRPR